MNKKIKVNKTENEDVKLIKKMIIILIVVVLIVLGFYFLTDKVVKQPEKEQKIVDINYDIATVGTMFNRPYDEYFVLLYDSTKTEATYYNTLLSKFKSDHEDKIFYIDLSLKENSSYVKNTANKNLTKVSEAAFAGPTLIKIKDGKVVIYVDTKEEIKASLK